MATIAFDTLKFVEKLTAAGVPDAHAKAEAHALADVLSANLDELATKRDLKELELTLTLQIEKSRNATMLWMFTMPAGFSGAMMAVMAKGFHWL